MNTDRREFLKGTAWMGAVAALSGCASESLKLSSGGSMQGFVAPVLKTVRVGVVGLGQRGPGAVHRLAAIPGVEITALCDLYEERTSLQNDWLRKNGKVPAKEFTGDEGYKALCESDLCDVVYNATPWNLHVPIAVYAMEHGKHAMIEVPSATTLDECWQLVETSERTRQCCMQLENCCYGEAEMLCLNLVRQGKLGELVHGEAAYIHDLRSGCYADWQKKRDNSSYVGYWRLRHNAQHKGNQYETHGLGPICEYMNINRGDRLERLVSMESDQYNYEAYAKAKYPGHAWKEGLKVAMGDMNTTIIRTAKGKSIVVQHDVSSPRPYRRHNLLTGTLGSFEGIKFANTLEEMYTNGNPVHLGFGEAGGAVHQWFDFKRMQQVREEFKHPLWKVAGELAVKLGGHGGMDFLMDLRWCYCLQNGLPLDTDVYDLAAWCSLGELTERSVRSGGEPQEIPDFTNGGWRTAKPLGIEGVDIGKLGIRDVKKDDSALNV